MRLLHMLVLVLVATAANGQKITITAAAGGNVNSMPLGVNLFVGDRPGIGGAGMLQVKYTISNGFIVGLGLDAVQLSSKEEVNYTNINAEPTGKELYTYRIGNPAMSMYWIAEKRMHARVLDIGVGLIGGGTVASHIAGNDTKHYNYPNSSGFMIGAIAECDIRLNKRIAFNLMTTPRYYSLKFNKPFYYGSGARLFSIPLTFGLSFHL